MRNLLCVALLALTACVPGHTRSPFEANQPISVRFYGGHVVSVSPGAIGYPYGGIGITAGPSPGIAAGFHAAAGVQPGGGRVGVALGGIGIGPGVEAPAPALEYTVAIDGTGQIVQITQYVLPEDCQSAAACGIAPTQPVVIRVTGRSARVLPLAMVPLEFAAQIRRGEELLLPLGIEGRLASPPSNLCVNPSQMGCARILY